MGFGISTWNRDGVYNNYGIMPVSIIGFGSIEQDQKYGDFWFNVPPGFRLGFFFVNNNARFTQGRRRMIVDGNFVRVSSVGDGDFSDNTYPALQGFIIAQAVR